MFKEDSSYFIYDRIKNIPLIGGYTDEELTRWTFNLLEGIFSQQVTDQEYELVEPLFLEYFSVIQNVENASERLALFKVYLQYILALLMDGRAKED